MLCSGSGRNANQSASKILLGIIRLHRRRTGRGIANSRHSKPKVANRCRHAANIAFDLINIFLYVIARKVAFRDKLRCFVVSCANGRYFGAPPPPPPPFGPLRRPWTFYIFRDIYFGYFAKRFPCVLWDSFNFFCASFFVFLSKLCVREMYGMSVNILPLFTSISENTCQLSLTMCSDMETYQFLVDVFSKDLVHPQGVQAGKRQRT